MSDISDDAKRNREAWTEANAEYTDGKAEETWAKDVITWGVWGVPEEGLGTLGPVEGLDVVELGCGTAYLSAWLAKRGARPVGVDVTPAQLDTARRMQERFDLRFPLLEASAEEVPLPDASFDLVVSEYGASIWCDPHRWIPEAHRLLRPGGRLWFLRNSTISMLCAPDLEEDRVGTVLLRQQRGLGRLEWPDEVGVEWQLPHGELFRLLRRTGFDVVDLVELYPPDDAEEHPYYSFVPARVGASVAGRGDLGRGQAVSGPLVLASTSPQRRAILEQLRIPFVVAAPAYEEHDPPDADPVALVREHARGKAASVHADGAWTLGVDTTVHLDGHVYAKPHGEDGARAMLAALAGRTHAVVSGVCLLGPGVERVEEAVTLVTFRSLDDRAIESYVAAGEWEGRAGGYAIQGLGARLVERVDGDYLNVVGLPAALVIGLLETHAPDLLALG